MAKGERNPSVLAIVAAMNEREGVGPTLAGLRKTLQNLKCLVVDGHSTDGTAEIAERMGAEVLAQTGSGKGQAIAEAIAHINNSNMKYVVFTDADYTYPAAYLSEMIEFLEENPEVGMVCGNRFNRRFEPRSMTNVFYAGNRLLALAQRLLNGVHLRDPLTGLRVIRWKILKNWKPISKGFDIEAEMNHVVERRGYRTKEMPIHYRSRLGEKKLKLRHGFAILRRIFLESARSRRTL